MRCAQPTRYHTGQRRSRLALHSHVCACHVAASTATPQLASQAALERRPDLLRTHMPEWSSVVPQRRWNRRLRMRLARAAEAVAGRPVDGPLALGASAELLIAASRARRRRGSRAGALPGCSRQRGTASTPEVHSRSSSSGRRDSGGSRARWQSAHCPSAHPLQGVSGVPCTLHQLCSDLSVHCGWSKALLKLYYRSTWVWGAHRSRSARACSTAYRLSR